MKKRVFGIIASSLLMMQPFAAPVFAQEMAPAQTDVTPEAARIVRSGMIGTASWTIDANGVLKIGSGSFHNTDPDYHWPWSDYRDEIKKIDGTQPFHASGIYQEAFGASITFRSYRQLTSANLSGWDTSGVTSMRWMFGCDENLESLEISNWNTSSVTDMALMFQGCFKLKDLNLSRWNTSSVTAMNSMFESCQSLKSLQIGGWNTSSVTDMSSMFNGCGVEALDLNGWNTSSVTTMTRMFDDCMNLASLHVENWDTSSVRTMDEMFARRNKLYTLDLGSWDTSSVVSMEGMFKTIESIYGKSALRELNVSGWNTSNVSDMGEMFNGCSKLQQIDVSNWDVSSLTDAKYMFSGCNSLTSLDLARWNLESMPETSDQFGGTAVMFNGCYWLESVRYSRGAEMVVRELPQDDWYQDGTGPYAPDQVPSVASGRTVLLTRTVKDIPISAASFIEESGKYITDNFGQYRYTSAPVCPLTLGEFGSALLVRDVDYTVSYSNNTQPGTASMTINGIGSYSGSVTISYEIESSVVMYRLYNPNSGEHFYTKDNNEKNYLSSLGWKFEGEGWAAPVSSEHPVYRLYNENAGDHHYTQSEKEKDYLVSVGWKDEGIGWYSADTLGKALYRQYNPNAKTGSHNYTTDRNEHRYLCANGWKDEDIAWYGLK